MNRTTKLLFALVILLTGVLNMVAFRTGTSMRMRADQRTIDSLQIVLLDHRLRDNETFLTRMADCLAVTTPASDEDGGPGNGERRRRP